MHNCFLRGVGELNCSKQIWLKKSKLQKIMFCHRTKVFCIQSQNMAIVKILIIFLTNVQNFFSACIIFELVCKTGRKNKNKMTRVQHSLSQISPLMLSYNKTVEMLSIIFAVGVLFLQIKSWKQHVWHIQTEENKNKLSEA